MASFQQQVRFLYSSLKKGQYRYVGRLVGRKLGFFGSITPAGSGLKSTYHLQKKAAVESMLNFFETGEDPKWPLEIFLEVSNVCDLQCAMCPTFSALNPKRFTNLSRRHRGLFKFDVLDKRMEEALKHALVVHAFGYGEPTIHPKFRELIDLLAKYEVIVDFFSHGMHLSEEMCAFLVEKRVSKITISFSGASQEEYENVYLGGDFKRVMDGIKRLDTIKKQQKTEFPLIEINSLGFKHHVEKFPNFVEMMGKAGVGIINLKPLQTYDLIKELHAHASLADENIEGEILEKARTVASKYGVRLLTREYEGTMSNMENAQALQSRHKGQEALSEQHVPISELKNIAKVKKESEGGLGEKADSKIEIHVPNKTQLEYKQYDNVHCMEPFKTFYSSYDGGVYPCCFRSNEITLGDLNNQGAMEIWRSELFSDIRQNALKGLYPKALCDWCIKAGTYPKNHGVKMRLMRYAEWYASVFKFPFFPDLQKRVAKLPDNAAVFEKLSKLQN